MQRLLVLVSCVFLAAPVAAGSLDDRMSELRRNFTLGGKPVPPKVFADFGDDDLADSSRSIRVTIDLLAGMGSNLYAAPIVGSPGGWISQSADPPGAEKTKETIGYSYVGATRNGLMLVVAALQTSGTGRFYTLHILDVVPGRALDETGAPYDRLDLTVVCNLALGDRWRGDVTIAGDMVTVTTPPGEPNNGNAQRTTSTFEARRP